MRDLFDFLLFHFNKQNIMNKHNKNEMNLQLFRYKVFGHNCECQTVTFSFKFIYKKNELGLVV